MAKGSILYDEFFSHNKPYKLLNDHITRMLNENDSELEKQVKIFHDIAKLKNNFQAYIRDNSFKKDKAHSLLGAYFFASNTDFGDIDTLFGFLAIISHHGNVDNFEILNEPNINFGKCYQNNAEFKFVNEVLENAKKISFDEFNNINFDNLHEKAEYLHKFLRNLLHKKEFKYDDFINFKSLYSNLIFYDKFEAIFSKKYENHTKIDISILENHIKNLEKDEKTYNEKRLNFRKFVLSNFDANHFLYTLTAPTGYGKTLTALNFALKFKKDRVIFALPFTSIIDQTYNIICEIYPNKVAKIHHKITIDEDIQNDRYSKVKFILNSFLADINITTLYQLIYAIFGNSNKDNVKFHSLKNSVIIVDEAQALPYEFRKDFIKLCEIISKKFNSVFIFMSATMPVINSSNFREISDLGYFKQQNRYKIQWLNADENTLLEKIRFEAKRKHTLVVVNTVKKAQELYFKLSGEFQTYSLNGYMTSAHKQRIIKDITDKLNNPKSAKLLLISTQCIEAGVDLSFEVGFREISPVSSVIQTAGRINRNGKLETSFCYVFGDISKFSDTLYGDLNYISKAIFEILQEKDICENEILEFSQMYFEKIHKLLEKLHIENEIKKLEFKNINDKIDEIMKNESYKELIIVEPETNFISELEVVFFEFKSDDKFEIKEFKDKIIKNIMQHGVNVSKNDIDAFGINLNQVKFCKNLSYLPANSPYYNEFVGILKSSLEIEAFS